MNWNHPILMKKTQARLKRSLMTVGALILGVGFLWASGMSLDPGEFSVEHLLPGRVYVGSRDILAGGYTLHNKMDSALDFSVGAYPPTPDRLKAGYEPMDASWITFAKPYFSLNAGEKGRVEFYISVPDDKSLLGKKYQVQIVVQTVGGGSGFIRLGLAGRAFLTINGTDSPWTPEEKEAHQLASRFHAVPAVIAAENVVVGKQAALREVFGQPIYLQNDSDYPVRCSLKPVKMAESFVHPPPGYEGAPRLSFLRFSNRTLTVPAHGRAEVRGMIFVPKRPEYRDKKYYFVFAMTSLDKRVQIVTYGRLGIHTEK